METCPACNGIRCEIVWLKGRWAEHCAVHCTECGVRGPVAVDPPEAWGRWDAMPRVRVRVPCRA